MASFKKRPNGTWQATIYVGRDSNGKQLFKYVTCDSLKEAKSKAREIEQEIEEGRFVHLDNTRVVAWIEKWMETKTLSPSTRATYKSYIKNHYTPYFGNLKLKQLNEIHIKRFMAEKSKTVSQASVRRMTSVLKTSLADVMKQKSPAKDIKLPKEEKYTPRVPNDKEMETIHNAVRGTRDEPIVLLAAWCGLRRGEIFALRWNDIDWNNGTLRVDEAKSINEDNLYEDKRPKSENGLREVIVPEYLMGLLEDMRKPKKRKRKKKDQEPTNIVEISNNSDHQIFNMRPDSYSSYWAAFVRNKKLPEIRFHDLRHYHASWLYARGIPDQYAAQRLGHDIRVLKTIYQHLGLDRQHEIDNNIRQMYDNQNKKEETRQTSE
ncbi:phage integrase family protein [Desulforamulus reducens MI-1]|uniref:Phage integrase family protein n=1 Tax=Desulforamulus reducens (strain ATCC BAA-1160 / DSM 100696 / MI-1) TaxID=349161 RepID=A4J3R3_DESRM|nr:site-specific integrase [Desulforamulus reducens]ABO49716.1 phage integrase family protein [Desulforamulus reducens MI-1]